MVASRGALKGARKDKILHLVFFPMFININIAVDIFEMLYTNTH